LSQKIHCQATPSATAPPITGPLATARPGQPLQRADRRAAALRRERRADERERERHHERRSDALHGARGDQPLDRRRQRAGRRGDGEQRQPAGEQSAAADAVAERRGGHQQDREAEVVGVDGPFELLDARAEVEADRRQRRRHDERVERDHERGDRCEAEDPAR